MTLFPAERAFFTSSPFCLLVVFLTLPLCVEVLVLTDRVVLDLLLAFLPVTFLPVTFLPVVDLAVAGLPVELVPARFLGEAFFLVPDETRLGRAVLVVVDLADLALIRFFVATGSFS